MMPSKLGSALARFPGKAVIALGIALLTGCASLPDNVQPVDHFELSRYLGKWYEVARLDHSFERGLTNVTAEYDQRDDGLVSVRNRGFQPRKGAWEEAQGKARFVDRKDQGFLKVSFFGPFYGSYVIFELDRDNYQYAMVAGPDRSYLWILARTPVLDPALRDRLVALAAARGFDTDRLIWVDQRSSEENKPQ